MNSTSEQYKKFIIQTIVSPSTFYAINFGKVPRKEKEFNITQSDVEIPQEVAIGEIVAVNYENKLHRGLITDTYKRHYATIYEVWLMDKGKNIECPDNSVFILKTSELKNKKSNSYEIKLYGVKPTITDLKLHSLNLENTEGDNSILHKRESTEWSTSAFNFINDLFKSNKFIYVNPVDVCGSKIIGKIYYKEKNDKVFKSLAKTLCDKEFAIISKSEVKINYKRGEKNLRPVERISNLYKNDQLEEFSSENLEQRVARNYFNSANLSISFDKFYYSPLERFLNYSEDQETSSFKRYSSRASTSKYFGSFQELESAESTMLKPKVNLFRIVEKTIKLHEEYKEKKMSLSYLPG